ncbi:MAG TPA: methyltransferase [Pseudolabrys sp.]|nr:methyltransferase [Pseudolabrys sp.]
MGIDPDTTEDTVLGGRLTLRQPRRGHRVGHDAILLAAATAARAGEQAADLGAGVGGAGLALAARVPGLAVALIEIDASLAALAEENARRNKMAERVRAFACDVEDRAALAAFGLGPASLDRVLMNPPFNDEHRTNVSPDPRRRLAHAAAPGLLERWIATAEWLLKPQGTLTLIWRADALTDVLAALKVAFGGIGVLPVFPRPSEPAIRVLVRGVKAGKGALRDYPGLVLNDLKHRPTPAAEAILRGGETLAMAKE